MIATGLDVFDRTLHKTYDWLADLTRRLNVDDRHVAYLALRATLPALRDRITVEERVLAYIAREFSNDDVDPERAARATFAMLAERMTKGEIEDAKHIVPAQLRGLWP
jgi:uncharacterized protein (DUF2267 family)